MADLIQKLKETIHPSFILPSDKGSVRITEDGAKATNREYTIKTNLPHVALCLEKNRTKGTTLHPAFPTLNSNCAGICSVADSIVVCRDGYDGRKQCAFIIELKSGNSGKALQQIRSSKAFVGWVMELLSIHYGFQRDLRCFGLIVTARKIPLKGTSRPEKLRFAKNGKGSDLVEFAEWDHGTPLNLSQMLEAALG